MNDNSYNILDISNIIIKKDNNLHDNENYECYICFEKCEKKIICNCKNLFMHKKCQKKFIILSSQTVCPICKSNYKNIEYTEIIKYKLSNVGIDIIVYSTLAITNFSISILFFILYYYYVYNTYIFFIIAFVSLIISKINIIYIIYYIYKQIRRNQFIIYIPYLKKLKILY